MKRTPKFLVRMTKSQAFINQSETHRAGRFGRRLVSLKSVETLGGEESNWMYSVDNPRAQEGDRLVITAVLSEHPPRKPQG